MKTNMTPVLFGFFGFLGGLVTSVAPADAESTTQRARRSGEQVYQSTCAACHGPGDVKAPKLGDRAAWGPLIGEGQHIITAHGWVGVREMPPRGGDSELTLEEFGRAVAHFARSAGGDWKDPDHDSGLMKRIREEVEKRRKELGTD